MKIVYGRLDKNSPPVACVEWQGPGWYAFGIWNDGQNVPVRIRQVGKTYGPKGRERANYRARKLQLSFPIWADTIQEALWPAEPIMEPQRAKGGDTRTPLTGGGRCRT